MTQPRLRRSGGGGLRGRFDGGSMAVRVGMLRGAAGAACLALSFAPAPAGAAAVAEFPQGSWSVGAQGPQLIERARPWIRRSSEAASLSSASLAAA